jgi:hypothetical protein
MYSVPPTVCIGQTFLSHAAQDYHTTATCEEESRPLLCGSTATLFGYKPSAYEDSITVKLV